MTIAEGIKRARKYRLLTQKELAEKAGVSIDALKFWEQGRSNPKGASLKKMAAALDVSVDYLTGNSDDPVEKTLPPSPIGDNRVDFIDEVINMPEDQFRRLMRYYELLKKETGGHES